ncbi:Uu.00g038550.m01.CDS01 [Anthostomella pinea]|uniref:Uu.00g038550.m01.CDS01 n=1 Tax=Anthostomella pinea TaxID=933095 RepID=A0AAI8YDS1_9PEZI|nr:Uu.00g038550.m01.CDS01 [Anthostomella pinea]
MPLELQPATEADARRSVDIEGEAYGPNPFTPILFPTPLVPGAKDFRVAELAKELREDKTSLWLKVVDTDLEGEQMIAFAKWNVCTEKLVPAPPRKFPSNCNVEACELLFGTIAKQRVKHVGDRPHLCLRLLHTDPKHQGRGAGTMLIKWGVQEAKKRNLPAYLESSPDGHELYKRCGFHDAELVEIDLSKWGATEMHKTWSMVCDP